MGYFGKLQEKQLAQKLRKHGLSYSEILQKVTVSKDTLSRWCKDIPLTKSQEKRLLSNKSLGQHKGSLVAAANKRRRRFETIARYEAEAVTSLQKLSEREEFFIGIALYSAEGDKRKGGFANADPKLIHFMNKWMRKYLKLPQDKLRGAIWLHEGLNVQESEQFWSNLTDIPTSQFHKMYIAKNKEKSRKIRKNIHRFGVFSLRFSDTDKHRRIMSWISALFPGKIKSVL